MDLKKVVVDETGNEAVDDTEFEYKITFTVPSGIANYDTVEKYIWFSVYDCNFPGNRTEEPLSDTGFQLRVEKKLCTSGNGYTFSFDYFPLQDRSYGASSNPNISKNNLIIILDEFGHLLND